jgi:hypothetical protein
MLKIFICWLSCGKLSICEDCGVLYRTSKLFCRNFGWQKCDD